MNATFQISEVFQNSWKFVKSQIWVLAGLCIGFCLLSGVINLCTLPLQGSVSGSIITYAIITIISSVFSLGYVKNMFQIMDGEEPQFSAYMQSLPKVINMWLAGLIYGFVVLIGCCLLIIPGLYLAIRLQFYVQFIVDENAGIIESLNKSWQLTKGLVVPLFLLIIVEILIAIVGLILFGIGFFIAYPLIVMMSCYVYRILNRPAIEQEVIEI